VSNDRRARRTALWGVIAAVFLVGTGVGSVLPILPLFLRERGGSYALVGVVVGVGFILASLPWMRAAGRDAGLRPALAVTGSG
jgi:hypothetical protein